MSSVTELNTILSLIGKADTKSVQEEELAPDMPVSSMSKMDLEVISNLMARVERIEQVLSQLDESVEMISRLFVETVKEPHSVEKEHNGESFNQNTQKNSNGKC